MHRSVYYGLGGLLLGLAVGVILLFGLPQVPGQQSEITETAAQPIATDWLETGSGVGNLAPDFTLTDLDGNRVSLTDFRGQVVLLNFWATWCSPCQAEMPTFQAYNDAYPPDEFIVLGINFDEPEETVRQFTQQLDLDFPILLDPGGEIQALYNIRGYPSSVFIRPDGTIGVLHIGIMLESQLDDYLTRLGLDL